MICETRIIMGMPVTLTLPAVDQRSLIDRLFEWFKEVDERFSLFRPESEISRLNAGQLRDGEPSQAMKEVLAIAERTKHQSGGFFCVERPDGTCDPTGIVKGWAIKRAAELLHAQGVTDYCIDAGGDIQSRGWNADGEPWRIGIRNPFRISEIVKVVAPRDAGIATSGTYIRGQHIWNPHLPTEKLDDIVSITVIGPDVLEADRFATAAFAMGPNGVNFIESLPRMEAYQIDASGVAVQTSSFKEYVVS